VRCGSGSSLAAAEIDALQERVGVPLPAELRDVLRFTCEIEGRLELLPGS